MEGFGRPLACCLTRKHSTQAPQLGLEVGDQLQEGGFLSMWEEG